MWNISVSFKCTLHKSKQLYFIFELRILVKVEFFHTYCCNFYAVSFPIIFTPLLCSWFYFFSSSVVILKVDIIFLIVVAFKVFKNLTHISVIIEVKKNRIEILAIEPFASPQALTITLHCPHPLQHKNILPALLIYPQY